MLDTITSNFELLTQYFKDFFNVTLGWLGDLLEIQALMTSVLTSIPSYFTWLPEGILSVLLMLLSVVVIYKVLGRT